VNAMRAVLPVAIAASLWASPAAALGSRLFANEHLTLYEPQQEDEFGLVLASGDFNGDGADDLATSIPFDDGLSGFERADIGAVVVRYGKPKKGLDTGLATTFLNQLGGSGPDPAEEGDRFGQALASCDFDGDGFDDLAVGIPFEDGGDRGDFADSGAVEIYYGAPGGILPVAGQLLTKDIAGIPGENTPADEFGYTLACGDLDGDGFADLAIAARLVIVTIGFLDSLIPAGAVTIVPGSAAGLDTAAATEVSEKVLPGMSAENYENFGSALAIGDLDGDGFADLAVGVPGEGNDGTAFNGPTSGKGEVVLLFGGTDGFTSHLVLDESDLGGLREAGDRFGSVLAFGDFDRDHFADLAIGSPFEGIEPVGSPVIAEGGQVAVYYGHDSLGVPRTQVWTQEDFPDGSPSAPHDRFGLALASGDFDCDSYGDLAVGHPFESVPFIGDGLVTLIKGSATGLAVAHHLQLAEGFPPLAGDPSMQGEILGRAVTAGDFDGDRCADMVMGAPGQQGEAGTNVGAEIVLYGGLLSDGFESGAGDSWSEIAP